MIGALRQDQCRALTVDEVSKAAGSTDVETVFWILRHLAANPERGIVRELPQGASPFAATYRLVG